MVTLGEIFQEEFNADWKRDAKQQYANIPLVAVAVLPYKHKFIAKKGNHRTGALVEQQIGCSRIGLELQRAVTRFSTSGTCPARGLAHDHMIDCSL
jgi:hypothetical protein